MSDQLGSGDSGQDPVHHRPVCPSRVRHLQVEELGSTDVDASQIQTSAMCLVEANVERRQGDHAAGVDRSTHDSDECRGL